MSAFRPFEVEVIKLLAGGFLSEPIIQAIAAMELLDDYEYTGAGYFASVKANDLPKERTVCHKPYVAGEAEGYQVGFVVFLEDGALTLECYAMGQADVPEAFRDWKVVLSTP